MPLSQAELDARIETLLRANDFGRDSWNASGTTPITMTYRFETGPTADFFWTDVGGGFVPFSAADKAAFRAALDMISAIINVEFVEDNGPGDADFSFYRANDLYLGSPSVGGGRGGWQYIGSEWDGQAVFQAGIDLSDPANMDLILHEIMHALGLKHPGDYDVGGNLPVGPFLPASEDNDQFSLMSYNSNTVTGEESRQPMLYDIAALQKWWGANLGHAAGNDSYGRSADGRLQSIWDSGGTDEIFHTTGPAQIDLRQGAFSSFGGVVNLSIAYGTTIENARSGNAADTLTGNEVANVLAAGGGNDTVHGGGGNDTLFGAAGNDLLSGEDGDDTHHGESGADWMFGGAGNDTLLGGDDVDNIFGGLDDDMLMGGAGNDILIGEFGNDVVSGEDGDDTHRGDHGADWMFGGAGNDTLLGGADNDNIFGGLDDDTLLGGTGDDVLNGEQGNDLLSGEDGNDILRGGDDTDFLFGVGGNDRLEGGDGTDTLFGGLGDDLLLGGAGDDTLDGEQGNDILSGEDGNDTLRGGDDNDLLFGVNGDDRLEGGAGTDTGFGGTGNDILLGGSGNDILDGEQGNDIVSGEDGNDTLMGGSGDDFLFGVNGNDFLDGGDGNDSLFGGLGDDILVGATGNDTLTGEQGNDTFAFADGFGLDTITDFEALNGAEKIDLRAVSTIGDQTDLFDNHLFQVGGNVEIRDGLGNVVTLLGVSLGDLDISDFDL